jgi:beta-lactam-binding protein with PASTA domain
VRQVVTSFLWVFPFISFLLGYQAFSLFSSKSVLQTPSVLGKQIHDAIKELSFYQLNVRILKEKDDPDFPDGIVISQSPQPSSSIKPHKSVFLVITRKPPKPEAPNLYGLTPNKASKLVAEKALRLKTFELESMYPKDTCIAQSPSPAQPVNQNNIIAYISSGTTSLRIFPVLKNRNLQEVRSFLKDFNIQFQVHHTTELKESHTCTNCIIVDHRPLAGSLVDLRKPFTVQLTVE